MDYKERLEKISQRNLKKVHKQGQHWPVEKKIEVVSQYLVLGNMNLVAAVTGVSYGLLRQWKQQPWWPELEKEIRATQNIEMDTKLSKIVDKSLDAVLDRVENGDFIYDQKSGEIRRKPASLRDVHRVSVDVLDKRELLRHGSKERQETTQISVQEQLKLLASEFARMVNAQKAPVIELNSEDVTDVTPKEDTDAVHEEWEEGLQEGEREIQLAPGGSGEEGAEESSEGGSDSGGFGPQRGW